MEFVVGVVHPVENLPEAADFFCSVLGFQQKAAEINAVVVENGAISIRLMAVATEQPASLCLELQTTCFNKSLTGLLARPNICLAMQTTISPQEARQEALLQAPFGLKILLVQEFDEDQLGVMPPLPSSLLWDDTAETCVKKMLRLVPISFRQSARIRVTERAEMLAGEIGEVTVGLPQAVAALLETTPSFQQPSLIAALQQERIDTTFFPIPCL